MQKNKTLNLVKHTLRILISAIISFIVLYFYQFDTFLNIMLFFGIYLVVSLILEKILKS